MGRIKFEDISEEEDLVKYLKQVLSRYRIPNSLYHYTKFSTFKKICENEYLRLSKPLLMNDKKEYESIAGNGLADRLFYTCFSLVPESAEMWNMYTDINDGCMIEIKDVRNNQNDKNSIEKMLSYSILRIENEKRVIMNNIGTLNFNSVAYYTEKTDTNNVADQNSDDIKSLRCMKVFNTDYDKSLKSPALAGMVKSDFWRFENEARLILRTNEDYKDAYFGLELPKDFWSRCCVWISPFNSEERAKEIKDYCKGKVDCKESMYLGKLNYGNQKEPDAKEIYNLLKRNGIGIETIIKAINDYVSSASLDSLLLNEISFLTN